MLVQHQMHELPSTSTGFGNELASEIAGSLHIHPSLKLHWETHNF